MKTHTLVAIVCAAVAVVSGGCGPGTGYVIKPVALDEDVQETVVHTDGGMFLTSKIAVIDLDGVILNARQTGLLSTGENPVSLFIEKLDRARKDRNVKAVVLRINSPGGGVTASDIIYDRLKRFRRQRPGVPIIAIFEDIGASGAYYIACGADRIMAHPTSTVGSIGVIVQLVSFAGTMDKLGITAKAVTSGPRKDMGSPLKPLDAEDQAVIQKLVDDYYGNFLKVVQAGRPKLTAEQIKTLADGSVWSAREAKAAGLVDSLGYMDDAIAAAKQAAGIRRAKVVMYHRPWGNRSNVYASGRMPAAKAPLGLMSLSLEGMLDAARPRFLYLWTGRQ